MRQTSRAVALLLTLESVNAAAVPVTIPTVTQDYQTSFNTASLSATAASPQNQMSNRMAPYYFTPNQPSTNTWSTPVPFTTSIPTGNTGTKLLTVTLGSKCMTCIGGGGVWCSRTYAYNSSVVALSGSTTLANGGSTATIGMMLYPNNAPTIAALTEAKMAAGAGYDNGSCCAVTQAAMIAQTGRVGLAGVKSTITGNQNLLAKYVAQSCVAYQAGAVTAYTSASGGTDGKIVGVDFVTAATAVKEQYGSWWCSNGLYSRVTAASTSTFNVSQPLFSSSNQRQELAFAACPQIQAQCGAASPVTAATAVGTTSSNNTVYTVTSVNLGGPTNEDKCTWVYSCTQCAPTFTMSQTASTGLGIKSPNWQIHSMEYVATLTGTSVVNGGLIVDQGTAGYSKTTAGLTKTNFLPRFDMDLNQYNMLRTWYGRGQKVSTAVGGNWLSPYQNSADIATLADQVINSTNMAGIAGQWMGQVANMPDSTFGSTAGGTGTYGKVSTAVFDARVVRYFPAQVAAASWSAGNKLYGSAGSYAAAVTTYTTAKTNWDAYVAILKKNAKADAFAAAFSPPKAPTVPPLPAQPWVPGNYAGYIKQTPAENALMMKQAALLTNAGQPTNQQFWLDQGAAMTTGGWGVFTAQVMTYRNGWGKSFGTIGYSGDANKTNKSVAWWYPWTCSTTATTGVAGTLCDKLYTTTAANKVAPATATSNAVNAVPLYVAVSLWSLGNGGSSAPAYEGFPVGKNDLIITFIPSAWDNSIIGYTAFSSPTATTAASSLTGIAGAQALAASAAAALAAAAALY